MNFYSDEMSVDEINLARIKHLTTSSDPVTEKEKEDAYQLFLRTYNDRSEYAKRTCTQLRNAREALQLTAKQVAEELKVSQSTLRGYEEREETGAITLKKLKEVAAAMDCEIVYEIHHRSRKPLKRVVWEQAFEESKNNSYIFKACARMRAGALRWLISQKLEDPEFRRKVGWTKRKNKKTAGDLSKP